MYDDVDDVEVVLFLAGLSELAVPYSVLAPSLPGSGLSQPASDPVGPVLGLLELRPPLWPPPLPLPGPLEYPESDR